MTPEELKARRKEYNLTQAQLAKKLGITLRHYNRLETGSSPLIGALKKVVEMELKKLGKSKMTIAQFKSIRDQLTLQDIAHIIRSMNTKIKIQHPKNLECATWATADYIEATHKEILIQTKVHDRKFRPFVDAELMNRIASCLYDMTDLVRRTKFDEAGEAAFKDVIEEAIDALGDAMYPVI